MRRIYIGRRTVTVGLDIGSGLVKAAAIDHAGGEPRLMSLAMAPLDPYAIVDGDVLNQRAVSVAIRQVLAQTDQPDANLVIAVGGRDIFLENLSVARLSDGQRQAMDADAPSSTRTRTIPLHCHLLSAGDSEPDDVVLVTAQHDLVEQRLGVVREAGYEPDIIDAEACALVKLLDAVRPQSGGEDEILVSVGYRAILVLLLRHRRLAAIHHLPIGLRRVQEALTMQGGVTAEESRMLVATESIADPALASLVRAESDAVARAIEKAARGNAADRRCNGPVYLVGGGSAHQMRLAIERRLGRACEVLDPLASITHAGEMGAYEDLGPIMALPIGLALYT